MFVNDRPGGRTFDTERDALVRRLAVGRGGCEFWVLEWRGFTVPFGTIRRWRKEPSLRIGVLNYEAVEIGYGFPHLRPEVPDHRFASEGERREAAALIAEALSVSGYNYGDDSTVEKGIHRARLGRVDVSLAPREGLGLGQGGASFVNYPRQGRTVSHLRDAELRHVQNFPEKTAAWVFTWEGRTIPFYSTDRLRKDPASGLSAVDYDVFRIGGAIPDLFGARHVPQYRFVSEAERREATALIVEGLTVYGYGYNDLGVDMGAIRVLEEGGA